jgi:hypothetical protein
MKAYVLGYEEPFYEAGSCQEEIRDLIGFTLLFEFPQWTNNVASHLWSHSTVRRVSFWAASFALRVPTSFSSYQSVSDLALVPLEFDPTSELLGLTFSPWSSLPRLLTLSQVICGCQSQARLSRNMAQHFTSSFLPTATIAIFLRPFLPPLRR